MCDETIIRLWLADLPPLVAQSGVQFILKGWAPVTQGLMFHGRAGPSVLGSFGGAWMIAVVCAGHGGQQANVKRLLSRVLDRVADSGGRSSYAIHPGVAEVEL